MSQQSQPGTEHLGIPGEPLVLSQQWKIGNTGSDISEGLSCISSSREFTIITIFSSSIHVNQSRTKVKQEKDNNLPSATPFLVWAATRRRWPTFVGHGSTAIKAIRTMPQLRLRARVVLICGKLTMKPTIKMTISLKCNNLSKWASTNKVAFSETS